MNINFSDREHLLNIESADAGIKFSVEAHREMSFRELGFSYIFYLIGWTTFARIEQNGQEYWVKESDLKDRVTNLSKVSTPRISIKSSTKQHLSVINSLGDSNQNWNTRIQEVLTALSELKQLQLPRAKFAANAPSSRPLEIPVERVPVYTRAVAGDIDGLNQLLADLKSNKDLKLCLPNENESVTEKRRITLASLAFRADKTAEFSPEAKEKSIELVKLLNELKDYPELVIICNRDDISLEDYEKIKTFADSCYDYETEKPNLTERQKALLTKVEAKLKLETNKKISNIDDIIRSQLEGIDLDGDLGPQIEGLISARLMLEGLKNSRYAKQSTLRTAAEQISRAELRLLDKETAIFSSALRPDLRFEVRCENFTSLILGIENPNLRPYTRLSLKTGILDSFIGSSKRAELFAQAFNEDFTLAQKYENLNLLISTIGRSGATDDEITSLKTSVYDHFFGRAHLSQLISQAFKDDLTFDQKFLNLNQLLEKLDLSELDDFRKELLKTTILEKFLNPDTLFNQAFPSEMSGLQAVRRYNLIKSKIDELPRLIRKESLTLALNDRYENKQLTCAELLNEYGRIKESSETPAIKRQWGQLLDSIYRNKMRADGIPFIRLSRGKTVIQGKRGGHASASRQIVEKFQSIRRAALAASEVGSLLGDQRAILNRLFEDDGIIYKMVKHAQDGEAFYEPEAGFDNFRAKIRLTNGHLLIHLPVIDDYEPAKRLIIPIA